MIKSLDNLDRVMKRLGAERVPEWEDTELVRAYRLRSHRALVYKGIRDRNGVMNSYMAYPERSKGSDEGWSAAFYRADSVAKLVGCLVGMERHERAFGGNSWLVKIRIDADPQGNLYPHVIAHKNGSTRMFKVGGDPLLVSLLIDYCQRTIPLGLVLDHLEDRGILDRETLK